jgi:hypothetical protein
MPNDVKAPTSNWALGSTCSTVALLGEFIRLYEIKAEVSEASPVQGKENSKVEQEED